MWSSEGGHGKRRVGANQRHLTGVGDDMFRGIEKANDITEGVAQHGAEVPNDRRKGTITDILEESVLQPLLVSISSVTLATETVRSILKIDDIVNTR